MPVIKHGSEELKRRYLPRIATGEIVMSFGVTEPNAGTDTSRIQTRADRHGDGFVVNGRKVWNTNAQHATHMLLLARTAPRDAAKPYAGLTLFFTPFDRAKITVREIEKPAARRWTRTRSSSTVWRSGDRRRRRGRPRLLPSARLAQPERIFTGVEAVGIGRAALERAVQYAKDA